MNQSLSMRKYVLGFGLSLTLTLLAYWLVATQALSGQALLAMVVGLAVVQFVVQMIYFLHLADEGKPRWKSVTFLFMIMVLVIVVWGSLWIMQHLNYSMPANQVDNQIIQDEGIRH